LTWVPSGFIQQIQNWLNRAAIEKLHEEGQALEPFVLSNPFYLILPPFFEATKTQEINIYYIYDAPHLTFIYGPDIKMPQSEYVTIGFKTPVVQHGIIRYTPDNLERLSHIFLEINFDLDSEIINVLKKMYLNEESKKMLNKKALFIISVPLSRLKSNTIERIDNYAFITTDKTLNDIGIEYGIFGNPIDSVIKDTGILIGKQNIGDLAKINIYQMRVQYFLDSKSASFNSGVSVFSSKIVAIGVGALGSQIINNMVRSGFGHWTLIDEDIFLPHNAARHLLNSHNVGYAKARVCKEALNSTVIEPLIDEAICSNILKPDNTNEKKILEQSHLIFDFSASIAVSRYLAKNDGFARSLSAYLTPDGRNLVVAVEDDKRNIRLDWLEMLHYREVINNQALFDSLNTPAYHRYGNSCRDISVQLPQDDFAIWSGFTSKRIRELVVKQEASLDIFYRDEYDIKHIAIEMYNTIVFKLSDWNILFDEYLINKMSEFRKRSLPNETGGVLLGNFDTENEICYIIDFIPSLPDSEELPVSFLRGCEGLSDKIKDIEIRTLGQVRYIGEWHSHPNNYSTSPSDADLATFAWLHNIMGKDCLPAIMIIIGENNEMSCIGSDSKQLGFSNA
jgi:integrative and conjugative element protein (TIGR02256 family)